jgi:hypothetical protein
MRDIDTCEGSQENIKRVKVIYFVEVWDYPANFYAEEKEQLFLDNKNGFSYFSEDTAVFHTEEEAQAAANRTEHGNNCDIVHLFV